MTSESHYCLPVEKRSHHHWVVVLTTIAFIAGTIGSNIGPAIVENHPALLLTLSARNRNLFASVPFIDPLAYWLIGFLRLMFAAVCLFFVGRWYGERSVKWVESQVGELPAIYRWTERLAERAGWLAILLMPGSNIVCLFVGHKKMPPRTFVSLAAIGVAIKLAFLWVGGKIFEDQIRSFLSVIEDYQWWLVIGLFAITVLHTLRRPPLAPPAGEGDESNT